MFKNSIKINQLLWKSKKSTYSLFRNSSVIPVTKVNTARCLHLIRDRDSNSKRYLSVFENNTRLATNEDIKAFRLVYFDLVKDLVELCDTDMLAFKSYFERMLCHFLPEKTHGIIYATTGSYKILGPPEGYTTENMLKAIILGWCAELGIYSQAVMDDIYDQSVTRHHRLCWHRYPDVGLRAISDMLVVESGLYLLIKKYFSCHPSYTFIMELFQEILGRTMLGQSIDLSFSETNNKNMSQVFTMQKYLTLTTGKAGCLGDFPLRLAMYLNNIMDERLHKDASNILFKLAHLWQVENDIYECYDDPSVVGKTNTDIQSNRCTWLIVEALKKASPIQMKILEENYGRDALQCEVAVKNLYQDLNLYSDYILYEENMRKQILKDITDIKDKSVCKALKWFNNFPTGYGTLNSNYDIINN